MSSDQIQPERDFAAKPRNSRHRISGRAWVKRDLEFWHRCTVEAENSSSITVVLDNMDELTVAPSHVKQFELERGELVFVQHWEGCISGNPAFVFRVKNEMVEVDFPVELFGQSERRACLLRDIRLYGELPPIRWNIGAKVFAYKAMQWNPPLFLMFPATVQEIHNEVCAEVEFVDGAKEYVPITLLERFAIAEGDIVYTCTSYLATAAAWQPDEKWGPCRVLRCEGKTILLQDGAGARFETAISTIAILPRGYRMIDGIFEKIPEEPVASLSGEPPVTTGDVHIVRTADWRDASDDPITQEQVSDLIGNDIELAWPADEWFQINDRPLPITWRGQPCFFWRDGGICCTAPSEKQLAKLIDIAVALDANVLGEDGTEYH